MRVSSFLRAVLCVLALLTPVLLATGCDSKADDDDSDDEGCKVPEKLCELCDGIDVDGSMRVTTLQYDNGKKFSASRNLLDGDIEVVNFIPEGPFWLKTLAIHFSGGAGKAIVHVYGDYGRSWPDEATDLIEPFEVDVPEEAGWMRFDVSDRELYFHPSEHFWIGYEHTAKQPYLSMDNGNEGDAGEPSIPEHSKMKSQALIDQWRREGLAYVWDLALSYSYLVHAEGAYLCEWEGRGMTEVTQAAGLTGTAAMRTGWSDLDGDGWDDIVLTKAGYQADSTVVFKNGGDGTFTDVTASTGLSGLYQAINLMGDVDNDGDQDVFASVYVPQDFVVSGPDGTGAAECAGCPMENAKRGALVGKVGESGTPFVVGADYEDSVTASGNVFLIVNDDAYANNEGQYEATVDGPGKGRKATDVVVPGNSADWTDTGVALVDGDPLTVAAEGQVVLSRTDTGARSTVLLNDGDGTFSEVADAGVAQNATSAAAAFGDYDGDGILDLYVGNWLVQYPQPQSFTDVLFRGAGDGTFADVSDAAGLTADAQNGDVCQNPDPRLCGKPCYGVVWGDYDNDGDLDIYVGNYGREDNFLWRNNGDGTFDEVADALGAARVGIGTGGNTFGVDFGDFDNDGNLDIYATNIAHPRYQPSSDISAFLHNAGADGDYAFTDVREAVGVTYDEGEIEASFVDVDNDGDLDLSLSDLYPLHYFRLYRQNDDHSFTDITYQAGLWVHNATNHAWADYDHDGDVDLLVSNNDGGQADHLFRNDMGAGNHWLMVRLTGTDSNRDGVGARVYVTTGTKVQFREVKGGKGHFNSQPSLVQHFGLGEYDAADEVRVVWPSGQVDTFADVSGDAFVRVTEGGDLQVEP